MQLAEDVKQIKFTSQHFHRVINYVNSNLLLSENIEHLIDLLKKYGDVILVGGSIKDIAFTSDSPKDYDIVVMTNKDISLNKLSEDFNVTKNSFGCFKLLYEGIVFDIWSTKNIRDFKERVIQLNADELWINLSQNEYYATGFNKALELGRVEIIGEVYTHPNNKRLDERIQKMKKMFNLK